MSNVFIEQNKLDILATAISNKSGEALKLTLDEMVSAVDGIETGGGTPTLETVTKTYTPSTSAVTDTITASAGYDGIEEVDVTVSAVSSGSLYTSGYSLDDSITNMSVGENDGMVYANYFRFGNAFYPVQTSGWIDSSASSQDYISLSGALQLSTQSATAITPTESSQTAVAKGKFTTGAVTVNAIPSNYVGSGITQRSSSDLTASGATVTVPSGYYSEQASKAVASGTATAPSTISGTSATVSTGTNTLTLSKTVSVTPQVTAGYVSTGTAGNSSVSLTANVTTQGAQTIYPSTSDQSISASRYLTGAQTIKAVTTSNLTADNIKNGVTVTVGDSADADRVLSVTGTYIGGGGSSMNVQIAQSTNRATSSTYTSVISLTCTTAGKYDIYWDCFRSSTGGTSGSQLYVGGTGYGTANTAFTNHVQNNHLTGVTLQANQTVAVYARSRGSNYYAYVGTLVIKQTS